jgi:hypothetical protein
MTIKEILAKVGRNEALTDEEKSAIVAFDPDAAMNAAAAAARKKAETEAQKATSDLSAAMARLSELETKLAEAGGKGKSEVDTMRAQLDAVQKKVADLTAERGKLIREQKLADVIRGSGIQFVKEVDGSIMRRALEGEFAPLSDEDLADADKCKPIVDTFRARNKAVILDASGHGSERHKEVEEMTPDQRKADLKKRGIL